jgi:hypothetical protein
VRKGYTPGAEDLRLLSEHLCYEVEMTFHLADWLIQFAQPWSFPLHNAVLEAWTVHLRQLIEFFWPQGDRRVGDNPDALAADFFEESEWERLCPERPEVLGEAIRQKIGWGVVHLTYGRAWSKPDDKGWDFVGLSTALAPAVIALVDNVEPGKLDPDDVERMRECAERWGGRGGGAAMDYLSGKTS